MNMRCLVGRTAILGLMAGVLSSPATMAAADAKRATDQPIHIGSGKQLFFDDKFIAESKGVRIVMNPPAKAGQVVFADRPWEDFRLTSYFTVVQDGDVIRMYYSCFSKDQWHTPKAWELYAYLCYAESKDGVRWTKPELGIIEFDGSKKNNIILRSVVDGTVFIDPKAAPERRYKLLHTVGPHAGGLRVSYSADGIHFITPKPVSPWCPDSQQVAFWDGRLGKYTAFLRKNTKRGRSVGRVEMANIEAPWPGELWTVFEADDQDPRDVDFYNNACVKYPWADDAYFMFPSAYHHFPPQMGNDGLLDISAAASRDGVHWVRPDRGPYLALGEADEWDAQLMMMGPGLVRMGNHIYQYYNGVDLSHGGTRRMSDDDRAKWRRWSQVGRAVQRLDGFYSADADYAGGRLVTPPVVFAGSRLALNVNTSSAGHARVGLIGADGKPLPGFSAADCDLILTNNVAHTVTWKGKSDVSKLAGKPIRLRFEMRSTKLYAFQFQAETR